MFLPDAIDGVLADLLASRHRPATPMRGSFGFGLQGGLHNRGHLLWRVMGFATAAGLNLPHRIQAILDKPLSPERGRVTVDLQFRGDLEVFLSFRGQQQNARAQGHLLGNEMSANPLLELGAIRVRERDGRDDFGHAANSDGKSEYVYLFMGHYTRSRRMSASNNICGGSAWAVLRICFNDGAIVEQGLILVVQIGQSLCMGQAGGDEGLDGIRIGDPAKDAFPHNFSDGHSQPFLAKSLQGFCCGNSIPLTSASMIAVLSIGMPALIRQSVVCRVKPFSNFLIFIIHLSASSTILISSLVRP